MEVRSKKIQDEKVLGSDIIEWNEIFSQCNFRLSSNFWNSFWTGTTRTDIEAAFVNIFNILQWFGDFKNIMEHDTKNVQNSK